MAALSGLGVIATVEQGAPRLRPLEFFAVDGELWAAAQGGIEGCDGQQVEVQLFPDGDDFVDLHGVLHISRDRADCQRLQQLAPSHHAPLPTLVIKIIPQEFDLLEGDRHGKAA